MRDANPNPNLNLNPSLNSNPYPKLIAMSTGVRA